MSLTRMGDNLQKENRGKQLFLNPRQMKLSMESSNSSLVG